MISKRLLIFLAALAAGLAAGVATAAIGDERHAAAAIAERLPGALAG